MVSYHLPQKNLQNSPNKNLGKPPIIKQKGQNIVSQTIIRWWLYHTVNIAY